MMKLDLKISMATIADFRGQTIVSDHTPGITNLVSSQESKKSFELDLKACKTHCEIPPKKVMEKYVLAEYEKIERITMPFRENHLAYFTTETRGDYEKITSRFSNFSSGST